MPKKSIMPSPTPSSDVDTVPTQQARVLAALRALAGEKPLDEINYGDVASRVGLPWQTVKRLLGPRESFGAWLDGSMSPPPDTRSRIVDAAARVFARKGYLGASLDEVAADAGLTKGAVYWHFSSKLDLFFALLDSRMHREYDEHLPPALEAHAANPDPKAALNELMQGVIGRIEADPDWPRLFLEFLGQAREPEVRARVGDAYQTAYRRAADVIRAMHGRPEATADDAEVLAIFWSALMDGLIIAWLANPDRIDLKTLMPRIVDQLWHGLAPASR
jgi:TetR/AcrR family acrAB operon transcriptional repressor